ncbi:hypothetical protein [Blastococcus sp. PRF04-17]|uniref:hypothetical protein n=1 Tax=Blastococcus sp. PRF04-17 TaxID=2933797 RepID=UPI001FF1E8A6|nr:hypothetical protein [Blastococcus sp. PRF04-17]UOY00292.1 hypothetical protein MVA48_14915 [Blastococcus sp. PRF04-17]
MTTTNYPPLPLPETFRLLNAAVENAVHTRRLTAVGNQHQAFELVALAAAQLTAVEDALDRGQVTAEEFDLVEFELDSARSAVLRQVAANLRR